MKRRLAHLLVIATLVLGTRAHAAMLDLAGYQEGDGAITVMSGGESVDPYFATRALLNAHDAGLNVSQAAHAWINWLLPRQAADGNFPRFCRKERQWHACAVADADDALLALWLELLFKTAPCSGLPPLWAHSAHLAAQQLNRLLDKKTGVYRISETLPVSLFMDNVEIYAAFRQVAERQACMNQADARRKTLTAAKKLRLSINRTFQRKGSDHFEVSTQQATDMTQFYPGQVAQIYPVLFRMGDPRRLKADFAEWIKRYGDNWLAHEHDVYPWGLVALAAHEAGDRETVECWLARAQILRHSPRWNVLEEASWQALQLHAPHPAQCHRALSQSAPPLNALPPADNGSPM